MEDIAVKWLEGLGLLASVSRDTKEQDVMVSEEWKEVKGNWLNEMKAKYREGQWKEK